MPLSLPLPFNVSFEFFPPKTPEMEESLWRAVKRLEPLAPKFVSVTYGAGGSTRERTHKTVQRILNETALVPAAHLTCADASRDEVNEVAHSYWEMGVRHIVALRGDPPAGTPAYTPHPQGYAWASELVTALRSQHDFEVSVATFPEGHPDSRSLDAELDNLKRKIEAGAPRAEGRHRRAARAGHHARHELHADDALRRPGRRDHSAHDGADVRRARER